MHQTHVNLVFFFVALKIIPLKLRKRNSYDFSGCRSKALHPSEPSSLDLDRTELVQKEADGFILVTALAKLFLLD